MRNRNTLMVIVLFLLSSLLVGCGSNDTDNQGENTIANLSNSEDDSIDNNSSSNDAVVQDTPLPPPEYSFSVTAIPTIEIIIEPLVGQFEISFYSIGILESGLMQISLNANGPIPAGEYQALISGDGFSQIYVCTKHPSLENLISCYGEALAENEIVSIQIIKPNTLTQYFNFEDSQLVSDQLSGGEVVQNPWKAWDMVEKCQDAKVKGFGKIEGCDVITLEKYVPLSNCLGPVSCANQCATEESIPVDDIDPYTFFNDVKANNYHSASCQDYLAIMESSNAIPGSMPSGEIGFTWAKLLNNFYVVTDGNSLDSTTDALTSGLGLTSKAGADLNGIPLESDPNWLDEFITLHNTAVTLSSVESVSPVIFNDISTETLTEYLASQGDVDSLNPFGSTVFNSQSNQEIVGIWGNSGTHLDSPLIASPVLFSLDAIDFIINGLFEVTAGANPMDINLLSDSMEQLGGFGFGAGGGGNPDATDAEVLENQTVSFLSGLQQCAVSINYPGVIENQTDELTFLAYLLAHVNEGNHIDCNTEQMLYLKNFYISSMNGAQACIDAFNQYDERFPGLDYDDPYFWYLIENLDWAVNTADGASNELGPNGQSILAACSFDGAEALYAQFIEEFSAQFPEELMTCMEASFSDDFTWFDIRSDRGMQEFYIYLTALKLEGDDSLDRSCYAFSIDDYFQDFIELISRFDWYVGKYIPSDVQECAQDLNYKYTSNPDPENISWEENFYNWYYKQWNGWGSINDYTWDTWPLSCKTDEFYIWLENMENQLFPINASDDEVCEECAVTYDCTVEPNLFYCSAENPDDSPFQDVMQECVDVISWPGSIATYTGSANLVAFLTAAAPWMDNFSMEESCEATLHVVAANHPVSFAAFTSDVIQAWKSNNTMVWGKDSPMLNILGTLPTYTVPDMSIFEIVTPEAPLPKNEDICVKPPKPNFGGPWEWNAEKCRWDWIT